jgi:hypothetical protein
MSGELLYGVNGVLIGIVLFILLMAAVEFGHRIGLRVVKKINDESKSPVGIISGAILGLLALLLGFTFAMAQSRFDLRQQGVVEESNSIATAVLRSRLLPEPVRTETTGLLRSYVDVRLDFYRAGQNPTQLQEVADKSRRIQDQLWAGAQAAVAKDDREVTSGLFLESLNDAFDQGAKRLSAMENHVPESVLLLLFTVALVAVLGVGYECGLGGHRHLLTTTMMAGLIVLVIWVIIDLDRPRRGIIRVNQNPMIRLQESLKNDLP